MSDNKPKKLSTRNVDTEGGKFVSKTLSPGNILCEIHSIKVETSNFKANALNIVLNLEGPDMGADFEGFFIDKDDKTKGRHKGQVARVRGTQWPFSDFPTKKGQVIERDDQMMKWLKNFCMAICALDWWDAVDGKYDTVEDLVAALNKKKPFAGKKYNFCIAGKIYKNKENYDTFDLFLPKFDNQTSQVPIEMPDLNGKRLIKFDASEHIIKDTKKNVSSFNEGAGEESHEEGKENAKSDFSLEDDEEN